MDMGKTWVIGLGGCALKCDMSWMGYHWCWMLDVMADREERIKFVSSMRMAWHWNHTMSSEDHPTQGVQNAKKKALSNAVDVSPVAEEDEVATKRWLPDMPGSQQELQWGSQPWPKPTWLDTKKSSGHHTTRQLKSIKEDQLVEQSESEEADGHTDSNGTNFDGTDFQVSSRPRTQSTSSLHMLTNEPETPMWADDLIVSESEESCNSDEPAPKSDTSTFINASTLHLAHADTMKMKSEEYSLDTKHKSDASSTVGSELSSHHSRSSSPKLVLTGNRKVKMTDQDITTRRVIQGAILKVKAHMTFINGYPELIEKTSFSHDVLLKAAHDHGATSVEMQIKNNDVEACVPLFHGDLKDDACGQVATYLHLGSDSIASAKAFIKNHSYHYFMQFSVHFETLLHLMKGRYFNGPKSVSTVFAHKFAGITKNKANQPEVPIPMVVLTSTSVYAALFWKAQGSPPKFNFTGNQFRYEDKCTTKFHKLMADIFAAIQDLMHTKKVAADSKVDALAFLDLDGMDKKSAYIMHQLHSI
ncbi:hypothetical protein EV702DRAFT_1050997 [Suillus placidus]|uniref:DUF6532 domain-containing protein n=1 Tax=Suillus placidus TaxID=48579 RepID=A0A9P7CWC1_9AGAM|nr:hypothetical protein EV702DRAFT_1050997 [Suillus placidus]